MIKQKTKKKQTSHIPRKIFTFDGYNLRTALVISALIHAIALTLIITFPELRFSLKGDRPMKINMIWVELPRGGSDDIGLGMKKAKGLPQSTIQEQKKLFQPKEPDQKTLPPMTVAKAEKGEKDEKGEVPKRPKLELKTTRRNEEEKPKPKKPKRIRRRSRINKALAKIDKELAQRQIVPEASQIKENHDGYKYGTGTKPLKVMPNDPEYLKYQAMVRHRIIRAWVVPLKFTEEGQGLNARLEVMINMDGEVVTIRWSSPSGNQSYDQSAMRAVKNASPFPKPPDRLAWEAYNEGFLIEFDPSLKTRY